MTKTYKSLILILCFLLDKWIDELILAMEYLLHVHESYWVLVSLNR